jgi:hypothetical protein
LGEFENRHSPACRAPGEAEYHKILGDEPTERENMAQPDGGDSSPQPNAEDNSLRTDEVTKIPMNPKVYLETTVPSYLTARASRDLVVAAHQELTAEWWNLHRQRFSLFVSVLVLQEAGSGDAEAARLRLAELQGVPLLALNDEAKELAKRFLERKLIPERAIEDAFHVAIATVHGMDYLLTWNCRHIANAEIIRKLSELCEEFGYELPTLCTPEQLMGD